MTDILKEDLLNKIAAATKDTGLSYNGCKIFSNPYIEDGIIYFLNLNLENKKDARLEPISKFQKRK